MRKVFALSILIVVFFPLAVAGMTMTSIRPWVLDRGFYERIVSDEGLYEALLTEDLSSRFDEKMFTADEQLPLDALSIALREVITPAYLRTQSMNVVNEMFNYIEGRERNFELSLDITPIKAALRGEGRTRFAAALAAALPTCSLGQTPIASGGRLTRCITADGSVDSARAQIEDALPAVLADTPDQIAIDNRGYVRMNWYDFAWFLGSGVHTILDVAILMILFTAVGIGFVGAYLSGDDLRGRLKWFSASLFAPASLFLLAGVVLTFPMIVGSISSSMTYTRWDGVQYSEGFREAIINAIVPVIQQVGSGVLLTGVIACLIALGLLILSWTTPAKGQQSPKIVQIPVRNS